MGIKEEYQIASRKTSKVKANVNEVKKKLRTQCQMLVV